MRGKATRHLESSKNGRITPAYAGKSYRFFIVACDDRDHPRLCGEKPFHTLEKYVLTGSPPPMRGKVPRSSVILDCVRITPAYAGKSSQRICERIETKDHPRLCGEKDSPLLNSTLILGSPPPMRGKAAACGFGCKV